MEHLMERSPRSWDSMPLNDRSRAWFVTRWPGRIVGVADAQLLFVVDIRACRCLCFRLFSAASAHWAYDPLVELLRLFSAPEALVTDDSRLQHVLAAAGASLENPASPFLDKSITMTPAIHDCIKSLEGLFNSPEFQMLKSMDTVNEALESWRSRYNERR